MARKRADDEFEMGKAIGKAEAEDEAHKGRELALVPEHLAPYSDGLPFSRERAFAELEAFTHHEALHAQGLVKARIEIGKRLILLCELSGVPVLHGGDRKSEDFKFTRGELEKELEQRFPWMTKPRRSEYMAIARAAVEHPGKFKEWLTSGPNWKKGLAIIRNLEAKEIKALEAGEDVQGLLFDELDTISHEDLKKRLRKQEAQIAKGKEQLEAKNREIERLQKGYRPTEEQYHVLMEGFRLQFDGLMDRVDPEMMDTLRKENKPTAKMTAHYLEILGYMKKRILAALGTAEDIYGTADMIPENVWRPGMGAEIVDQVRDRALKG